MRSGMWIGHAVWALIFWAAASKLLDVPRWEQGLETWTILPPLLRSMLVFAVPAAECLVVLLWLTGVQRRVTLALGIAMLVLYSAALAIRVWLAGPPDCQCLGRLAAYFDQFGGFEWLFVRDALMIAGLAAAWPAVGTPPPTLAKGQRFLSSTSRPTRSNNPAFTLIEVLLAIVILALLIALTIPQIGKLRMGATQTAALALIRGHGQVFHLYAQDYKDQWPYFISPTRPETVVRGGGEDASLSHWDAHAFWPLALADGYYQGQAYHPSFGFPGGQPPSPLTPFHYACVFVAHPEFWNPSTRTGPTQWAPTRAASVLFPAQKLLLIDGYRGRRDPNQPLPIDDPALPRPPPFKWRIALPERVIALVDGGAVSRRIETLNGGYPRGDGWWTNPILHVGPSPLHTIDDVRGRDLR